VASADERIRVYDLDGGELAELGVIERDGRRIRIHKSAVREAVFSPGGQYLIAGDDAGQVVRWDLETAMPRSSGITA
jgi:WD40 repeat protein